MTFPPCTIGKNHEFIQEELHAHSCFRRRPHELHDQLGLTGCEVSVNDLPAGAAVPFVHAHQQNEELYGILSGAGEIWLDGEVIALRAGDWLRVAPAAKRAIRALPTEAMRFICIQTKCGSLEGFTMTDGMSCEEKAPWH